MKGSDPKLWIGAASLGFVIALFYHDLERTSPGALSRIHAAVDQLDEVSSCAACHGSSDQTMADACMQCHPRIGEQIGASEGFHGALIDKGVGECARCHLEHHGAGFELAGPLAYRESGFDSREDYDHASLGFELEGRHLELGCAECHPMADATMLVEGQVRFLDQDQACDTCHEDPHGGVMVRACADCHGQSVAFSELSTFVHSRDVELGGSHAEASCQDCHETDSSHSVEALAGARAPTSPRDCSDCHQDPHSEPFLEGLAGIAQLDPSLMESQCSPCHSPLQPSFTETDTFVKEAHSAAGFELEPPHDVACDLCHGSAGSSSLAFAQRFPGRRADDCAACHKDPHEGLMGNSCVSCHTLPHPFQGLAGYDHASVFPLEGAHAGIGCADCHDPASEFAIEVLVESGQPRNARTCGTCHSSPHSADFLSGTAAQLERQADRACAACHDPQADAHFAGPTTPMDPDLHAASGFALADPHEIVQCSACHGDGAEPFDVRYPGREQADCAACHADPHGGAFDRAPYLEEGCTSCHDPVRFHPSNYGVAAHGATAFPLEGSHRAVPCSSCHPLTAEHPTPPPPFQEAPSDCAACHADAHAGAFDRSTLPATVEGDAGCARCHTSTLFSQFIEARFDHDVWTSYPLEGEHANASCEACHILPPGPKYGSRDFGLTLGTECQDCHADPHVGQFASAGVTRCADCHASPHSFSDLDFDHDVDSSFPLDAQHEDVDCAKCHRPWPLPGGGEAVRYKPLGTLCGDCHTTKEGPRRGK